MKLLHSNYVFEHISMLLLIQYLFIEQIYIKPKVGSSLQYSFSKFMSYVNGERKM